MNEDKKALLARVQPGETVAPAGAGVGQIVADCGCKCWVGQTMLAAILAGHLDRTECLPCSGLNLKDLVEMGQQGQVRGVPGIREEVEQVMGKQATDHIFDKLNVEEL